MGRRLQTSELPCRLGRGLTLENLPIERLADILADYMQSNDVEAFRYVSARSDTRNS